MSKVNMITTSGENKKVDLNENIWNVEINRVVLHDAVAVARNNARQGTHSSKTRAEVSGGGKKPWKQKGTGNARAGSNRSPIWVGGGTTFGPNPNKNYKIKMNRKERKLALKCALASKLADDELLVVESLTLENNKTKGAVKLINDLKIDSTVLFVTKEYNENLVLSTRNLGRVCVLSYDQIDVLTILICKYLVIEKDAVKLLEEGLV
ncbi:MAG: 50S ribosomal protein L4 [Bacilli bacterium]